MSQRIDAREVLKYLNELGYTGISASQLKQFITDLKILIKYDVKLEQSRETTLTTTHEHGVHDSRIIRDDSFLSTSRSMNCEESSPNAKNNVFDYLYTKETIASEAKRTRNHKENVISVQIKRPNVGATYYQSRPHVHCIHDDCPTEDFNRVEQINDSDSETDMLGHNSSTFGQDASSSNVNYAPTCTDVSRDTIDKGSNCFKSCKSKNVLKPKASFIRPRFGKTFKTDPVALYHQYQEEWKKQKIPGQDSRADLRWAIRERMLGDPTASVQSSLICNKRRPSSCQA